MNPKYSIRIKLKDGTHCTLSLRGRTEWGRATAAKHVKDLFAGRSGIPAANIASITLTSPF